MKCILTLMSHCTSLQHFQLIYLSVFLVLSLFLFKTIYFYCLIFVLFPLTMSLLTLMSHCTSLYLNLSMGTFAVKTLSNSSTCLSFWFCLFSFLKEYIFLRSSFCLHSPCHCWHWCRIAHPCNTFKLVCLSVFLVLSLFLFKQFLFLLFDICFVYTHHVTVNINVALHILVLELEHGHFRRQNAFKLVASCKWWFNCECEWVEKSILFFFKEALAQRREHREANQNDGVLNEMIKSQGGSIRSTDE